VKKSGIENIGQSAREIALHSGLTVLTLAGFKTIVPLGGNIRVRLSRAHQSETKTMASSTDKDRLPGSVYEMHLFRLQHHAVAFAARVGSTEPYGIDEAHDLFGGCGRFYTRRLSC